MGIFRELAVYSRLLTRVLPLVERELRAWTAAARSIPDSDLRAQALASLERKKFHCVGGSVLALMAPERLPQLVRAIVAIQTISDYLDNLCDRSVVAARVSGSPPRAGPRHEALYQAYLRLHDSMLCAVDPDRPITDYYSQYNASCVDGGYLGALVEASRRTIRELPAYAVAGPHVLELVTLYSELQAGKHLPPAIRDGVMERWFADRHRPDQLASKWLGRDLHWWEFAAATGSTLAIFALICASADPAVSPSDPEPLVRAYFPAICGLHILLDYYIDQAEDVAGGDLNFISRYASPSDAVDALDGFTHWALTEASRLLPDTGLHRAVVRGLLAMYLSDPKVQRQNFGGQAARLMQAGGGVTRHLCSACSLARRIARF